MQESLTDPTAEFAGEIVLELQSVSKLFGSTRAVDDVSLQVHRGEVLTLLGPSGSGKTTTLRMAIGLERLTHGEVVYMGRTVDSEASGSFVAPNKRNMGIVFESYSLWPHMTAAENIAYPLKVRRVGAPEVRERVSRILEEVGLGGMEQRSAAALSGDQQLWVAIARSLVFEPGILLLDEPFANVDAALRDDMRVQLRTLQQRLGITMLLTTSDRVEALSLSDRIAVMNAGAIEQIGTPMDLYRSPGATAAVDLLGRTLTFAGQVADVSAPNTLGVRLHDDQGPVVQAEVVHGDGFAMGSDYILAIRPEGITVQPLEVVTDPDAENVLRGVIETLLFVGDRFEARVELPWGESVSLYLSPNFEQHPSLQWREGQPVAMRLAPAQLHAWPMAAQASDVAESEPEAAAYETPSAA